MTDDELVTTMLAVAMEARRYAYDPYTQYPVGAAVLTGDQRIFGGCNVANASASLGVCAERSAVITAIGAGAKAIDALLVVTADAGTPCGACLQVMAEFAEDCKIILYAGPSHQQTTSLRALLPVPFALVERKDG